MSTYLKALREFKDFELDSNLEFLRNLRNSCRHYMTRSQEEINPEQQKKMVSIS
jgi:hypothetical protein